MVLASRFTGLMLGSVGRSVPRSRSELESGHGLMLKGFMHRIGSCMPSFALTIINN